MDYDDNDFQSQNFQLGADDNKFPLPKFDIDEHLQVNLRFDSLVDTDILLGIQNQDNNWIEDFSSGTSAIEFNSSAVKTHTISRHTNVWSEATSSESVEMLLKSVGEDEMNNDKAIAMEPDLQNTSNNLTNPVGPTPENDNDNSMMVTFVQDDPSLQPDKVGRNLPDQNTDASEEVRQCPESVSDVLACHSDLSNDDAQKASSTSVEPAMESDLQNTSNNLINPVGPTPENDNDNSMLVTFVQDDPSLQRDKVERNLPDQNTDASEDVRQCPESVSDVLACHSDLSNDDAQKASSPSVEPAMESDLQNTSNNLINPVNPTPENDNDNSIMATFAQDDPSLQPDKVERNLSDQNADASEEVGQRPESVSDVITCASVEPAMESDLQNTSNNLINQVNPTPENDNENSIMATFAQDGPSLQPEKVERSLSDQNADASEEVRQCPESVSDVITCYSDLSNDDAQKVSSPSVEPILDSIVLINDGHDVSENCDVLLEAVAYQVEVSNMESKAVEITGEKHTEIINRNEKELGNIEAAREVNSTVVINPKTPMKYRVVENSIDCDHPKIAMQIHETEIVVVEKSVEVSIVENDEESESKLIPQENAVQSISPERVHSTTEDVAQSVSADAANLKSNISLVDKAEVTTSELGDTHLADAASGFGVPPFEESVYKVKSHLDGPLSENRSSEQKETTSLKSQAYGIVNADAKEIKITEDLPNNYVQVPAFKNTAAADLVLEQNESEVSNQLSLECKLEGNVDNRQLEDPNICENKLLDTSPLSTMGVQHSCHVESSDGSQCKFQLQSLPDKPITQGDSQVVEENIVSEEGKYILSLPESDASPHANMQTISGEFSSHSEENILSTPSPSTVKSPITQGDPPVVEENIVSENEKYNSTNKSDASPDANMQTVSSISGYDKLPSHSEEIILSTPSLSAVKPPITQGDSPVVEGHVLEKEKYSSDKSDAFPDANMQAVSGISGYGELPSHSEDNILSTPSPSAVKPPIMEEDSPVVEEPIVFEKEKYKSDKSDASPDANMQTVSPISDYGELPSHSEENILSTPSPSAVKPAITQGDSPVVGEHTISEKEKYKFDESDASPDANMQIVYSISGYGELPSHSDENILSTSSPLAVKAPITQVDSPVVEEYNVSEKKKYMSDKSDASPDTNMQTVSIISGYGELPSHGKENILSTPSPSAVKSPIKQADSPVVEDHIVSEKEKSNKSNASPDANMQTASNISGYGESQWHSKENVLSTPSSSAIKQPITQGYFPVVEEHIVSEKENYKSDISDASPDVNMQAVSSISGYGELRSHSEGNILSTPSQSVVKSSITQGYSPVVEELIVSEKEKYKSDKSDATPDANMQTVSNISAYGGLPSHNEEINLSTPSSSAVKPPITQGDSPVVEEYIVSEKEKYTSDKSDASPDANMQTVSGEFPSHTVENIRSTPSPSDVKPSGTHLLAVETGKTSAEPSCGSPTIVNTSVPSHDNSEGYKIDVIKHIIPDSKKSIATEDDKSFSFEIRKGPNMADNNTGNQWKPFPNALSSESPKTPKEIAKATSEKKSTIQRAKSTKGTATRKKSTESAGISCTTPASVGTVSSVFQLDEVKLKAEGSRKRKTSSPFIQTSSLPDLNSSASASTLVHQPFSDIQQVQLRAQIFVYGSLIQGIPPDEACMQSAFGEKDGGKSIWETVWRKSVDRYQTQKSPANQETPLLSHSAVRAPNQETKSGSSQSKVSDTSASKYVGKSIAPAIPSTPLSVQSPVWNMTPNFPRAIQLDFNQASTPLHTYPSSQTRQFTNNSTPWLPSNPRPAQWAISAQSPALKSATQYSSVLAVDTVKVTSIRESSMPHTSLIPSPVPVSIPLESQGKTASPQKSRKRKKALVIEDISKTIVVSQSTPTSIVPKSLPTVLPTIPLTTNTPLKVTSEPIVETVPHISPLTVNSFQMINTVNDAQVAKLSEETGNKIEQAKLHAEEAASIAASVVSHGQGIWNQIAAHKNSSVPIEIETKLASAAAAAAAAASVAKAAASAAKVAFEAVVQAKVMADEAINSAKSGNHWQNTGANFDAGKNLAMLTPGSILKGKDKMHGSSTIISAACDAARKRVEEASAASKRAENLNAIMKAAELAAEAVAHVGTIIAMGDPLPFKLSELVEAGPEGSWKSFNKAKKLKDSEQSEKTSFSNQETHQTALKDREQPVEAEDNCDGSESRVGKSSILPNDGHEKDLKSLEENTFRKGSLVEVISDEDGLKGGWFSARVLDAEDNKVHVCYNNLLSDDGSEQLKEWVSLDSQINGAPRIRIAHPRIVTKNEGTKKRRREAANNYVWEVGDHVDAWMRDGWWEGIITEKSQLDETKLTVHFPAGGDSSLVRAWDLRTSLSWKDGQWTEWSRPEEGKRHEGDTPQEKRRKLTQLETKTDAKADDKGTNMLSKEPSLDIPELAVASRPLNISTKDTIFSLGKKVDNISEAPKGKRTGPPKEGPGVVFGVPKGPGKKQKFMDVSKHYSTDKAEKSNHGKDSLKFPKYLMPQASQPWRNTSKMDSRGKRVVDSKSTGVKSARSLNSNARNAKQKDSNTSVTTASNDENPEKNYTEDSVSSRPGSTESLVAAPNASKRKPSSVNEGDRGVKRRLTPSNKSFRSEKKSEVSENESSDANEPRRSTRKIQPTSRLLEGLQSSMMMSRIPSFSHGKSSKTPHRSSSSRGNTRG